MNQVYVVLIVFLSVWRLWVMTVPLKRLGSRSGELLGLAGKISEAVDLSLAFA